MIGEGFDGWRGCSYYEEGEGSDAWMNENTLDEVVGGGVIVLIFWYSEIIMRYCRVSCFSR